MSLVVARISLDLMLCQEEPFHIFFIYNKLEILQLLQVIQDFHTFLMLLLYEINEIHNFLLDISFLYNPFLFFSSDKIISPVLEGSFLYLAC